MGSRKGTAGKANTPLGLQALMRRLKLIVTLNSHIPLALRNWEFRHRCLESRAVWTQCNGLLLRFWPWG